MMNDFVAIDFETANAEPTSICAIGAVKVEGGVVTDRFYRITISDALRSVFTVLARRIRRMLPDSGPCGPSYAIS